MSKNADVIDVDEDIEDSISPRELLKLENIQKIYQQGPEALTVLKNAELSIKSGEMVALVGPSGAGKSTLLHIIGLLDQPDSGSIIVDGEDTARLNEKERTLIRRRFMGFVYQFHYLQPEFSALENVILPQMIAGRPRREAKERAERLLSHMGLGERLSHRPARLSGGEQQRVAIARALANNPMLLLADEPTGNLDPQTAEGVFDMLTELVQGAGIGALVATHNMDLADRMDRVLEIRGGRLQLY